MSSFGKAIFLALGSTAVCLSSPVMGRGTVIDQGESIPVTNSITACTIGISGCSAITLPFSFDFGTGSTNQAFVYDSGVVSFGAPIPLNVPNNASFTSFGVPVIAPLFVPGFVHHYFPRSYR